MGTKSNPGEFDCHARAMPSDPIPLDKARRRARRPPPPDDPIVTDGEDPDVCPILALGHLDGSFVFLDVVGQKRILNARQLGTQSDLAGLFAGNTAWLVRRFPRLKKKTSSAFGETTEETIVEGFNAGAARDALMRMAVEAGLFGDHVVVRSPGIWRDQDGAPVVHAGDVVITADGETSRSGLHIAGQVWAAAPPRPRPLHPCGREVGARLQDDLQSLWSFRQSGGAIILMGLLGTGYLGLAARWRPNGFLTGEAGSGKSMLIELLAAAAPLRYFSNNTTEAGVLGAVNGHVMPIFLDESSDRYNSGGAEALMDLVLAASSGDGTKGSRGKADGGIRTFEMAGVVIYGSIAPPPLQPQHMARITLVELLRPTAGEDNRVPMEQAIERYKSLGPELWARALAGWPRWRSAFEAFRGRLAEVGCAAREMDQMGSILAGWWILTHDGVPDQRGAKEGVAAIAEFVRTADEAATESGPRRAINHILASRVQYDGTTRQDQIAALLAKAFNGGTAEDEPAIRALLSHGIRPIMPCIHKWRWTKLYQPTKDRPNVPSGWVRDDSPPADRDCTCVNCVDRQSRPVPRLSDSGGIWLMPQSLAPLFRNQRGLEDGRWVMEILRLPAAVRSKRNVKVNGVTGKAIWLPREDIDPNLEAFDMT